MERLDPNVFLSLKNMEERDNLFYFNDSKLLKEITENNVERMRLLTAKELAHAILPRTIYYLEGEKTRYFYDMFYQKNYSCFTELWKWKDEFSSKEFLQFFRRIFETIQTFHQNGIYYADVLEENLLVNEKLNYFFSDFDDAVLENTTGGYYDDVDCLLPEYMDVWEKHSYSPYDVVSITDRILLLEMIIASFMYMGTVRYQDLPFLDTRGYLLPEKIEKRLDEIRRFHLPLSDDYFLDLFDVLISQRYELPAKSNPFLGKRKKR